MRFKKLAPCLIALIGKQQNTFLIVCMVYQTFRLHSPPPTPGNLCCSTIEVLNCHFSFWSPVMVGSSIYHPTPPSNFKKSYTQRTFAGSPVGRLCWGICKAGWRNRLFLSTKCIRWKIEWPTRWCELIHWKRGIFLEAWFVFQWWFPGGWCDILSKLGWGMMATVAKWWY